MKVALLILIGVQLIRNSDAAEASCPDGPQSATLTLRRKLFCDYDTNVRPVKSHLNTTDVELFVLLQSLIFHNDIDTLEVHSWSVWRWRDEHLVWNNETYEGIDAIHVSTNEIWVPDMAVWTSADMGSVSPGLARVGCDLDYNGNVMCEVPTVHSAICSPDITRWPFDIHNCSMKIGSWTNSGNEINLTLGHNAVEEEYYTPNRDWELLSTTAFIHRYAYSNNTYPWASISFTLKRHSGGHAATVFIPALVLAMLTLTIFWMEPTSPERIVLICFIALCDCLYLQHLGATLPANGDKHPIIVLFYRDSFLMVAVSLFVTLVVRRLDANLSAPPDWIITIINVVQETLPAQILINSGVYNVKGNTNEDDVTQLVETTRKDQRWHLFAALVDCTFFLIYFLTFIVLLCAFIP